MTGKQARGLFQALLMSVSVAVASGQATKNSTTAAQPTPSPTPAGATKITLPGNTERKAGGEAGTLSCDGKPVGTKARKAGGDPGINPCFKPASKTRKAGGDSSLQPCFNKPASSDMRKAGGQQQSLCTNEKGSGRPSKDAAGVVIAIRPSNLNGDGKTANSKTRKAGGDIGIIPCVKPASKKASQTGERTSLNSDGKSTVNGDGKTGLNGDGKPSKNSMRKAGGDVGIRPCIKPADKSRKAGGTTGFICDGAKPGTSSSDKVGHQEIVHQEIVRPNSSSSSKKAISGSTGGTPQPAVPQTQVPK